MAASHMMDTFPVVLLEYSDFRLYIRGAKISQNVLEWPQNSGCQKGDMMQVPYWGPNILGATVQNLVSCVDLVSSICAPLIYELDDRSLSVGKERDFATTQPPIHWALGSLSPG